MNADGGGEVACGAHAGECGVALWGIWKTYWSSSRGHKFKHWLRERFPGSCVPFSVLVSADTAPDVMELSLTGYSRREGTGKLKINEERRGFPSLLFQA